MERPLWFNNKAASVYIQVSEGWGDTRGLRDTQSEWSHNTHVVEKDEKQLLTAGYLLGLDSLETTHSYVNVKTKKGQMGQSDSSSYRAKEVSDGLKHTKQRNVSV